MATKLKPVDVVLVGVGWTGGILGKELTQAGLQVVGLERGRDRSTNPDFQLPGIHDELKYAVRYELMQDLSRETITFRNNSKQTALPMRQLGSFLPGEGLGGAGVHWNGMCFRFLPWDFETRSRTLARYGKDAVPEDSTIQDWGVTFDELEPFFDKFEYTCGIAGKAGNLKGKKQTGGNPFEGPRQRDYPNPPMKVSYQGAMFKKAAEDLGLHPFPAPSANVTRPYTNPDGVPLGTCVYCGYCERFGCEVSAKASPQTTVLPVLLKNKNFELRTQSHVTKINLDSSGKRAVSVSYVDITSGQEFEQPADIILLASYILNNVRLLLYSKIGAPYDPASGTGVVGRNYAYQATSGVTAFFEDKNFNPFMGAGALGMIVDDFNGDNFDHSNLGFIGGGYLAAWTTGSRPIQYHPVPEGVPRWGAEWKTAAAHYYGRSLVISTHGGVISYRDNYLDLDPTYRDIYGTPLLRVTFDWHDNELKRSNYLTDQAEKIAKAMRPNKIRRQALSKHYSIVPYQTTHNTGGAIMGVDPKTSVVNKYLQNWDVPNLFVVGSNTYPQNAGYNPTDTLGALTYWCADAIKNHYIKNPGLLV
ncbi:MAG TPA: GMC family oxidoreductase [Acidiferrobacterales bacterium]|nr:GMC family oxidoreductase [Acidiferrobacterales bacterium]